MLDQIGPEYNRELDEILEYYRDMDDPPEVE